MLTCHRGDTVLQYRDGLSHGTGTLTLLGEGEYKGDFVEGKKHGRGRWTGPDDMVYEGQYRQDRRHGETDACEHGGNVMSARSNKALLCFLQGMAV